MNWCRTVARFIGLNSAILAFFCENTAYFKKNRIRFLYSRNFWSVSRVDDVIHRSWHYSGILFPLLAIFKGFGGKNDGLRWYFLGLCLTSFSNTLATLKKVFVASWQHLGFKAYMSWRPAYHWTLWDMILRIVWVVNSVLRTRIVIVIHAHFNAINVFIDRKLVDFTHGYCIVCNFGILPKYALCMHALLAIWGKNAMHFTIFRRKHAFFTQNFDFYHAFICIFLQNL